MFTDTHSTQPCGCDEGAAYTCKWHQTLARIPETTPSGESIATVPSSATQEASSSPAPPVDPFVGIGGAPMRAKILPSEGGARKTYPIASGFMDYFPDAIAYLSHISWLGNEQHNPGQPLHWDRSKSADEADTAMRHFAQRGTIDPTDGTRHTGKFAWRALALLQKELEG